MHFGLKKTDVQAEDRTKSLPLENRSIDPLDYHCLVKYTPSAVT